MAIEQKRIEAAARARWKHFDRFSPALRDHALQQAESMISAAFPELASDPPTGWVAPMEPTEDMTLAYITSELSFCPEHQSYENSAHFGFAAMRDVYLKDTR